MYKRFSVILCLICILSTLSLLTSGAYFTTLLTSSNNPIKSANFKVNSDGTLNDKQDFKFEKFAPGQSEVYNFSIDKTGTEVPVCYEIKFNTSNDGLFSGDTPVKLSLLKYNDSSKTDPLLVKGNSFKIYPKLDKENYGLQLDWPWKSSSEAENKYAGQSGTVEINVQASQIKGNTIYDDNENEHKINADYVLIEDENYLSDNSITCKKVRSNNITVSYNDKENTIKIPNNEYLGDIVFYINEGKLECSKDVGFTDEASNRVNYSGLNDWYLQKPSKDKSHRCISLIKTFPNNKKLIIGISSSEISKWNIKYAEVKKK